MRQTYILDISDLDKTWNRFEKRTRGEIRKCRQEVRKTNDILMFDLMHYFTRPDRKIGFWRILWWWITKKAQLYQTDRAMAMISHDKDRGYYLMAARLKALSNDGSPSKIIWRAIQDLNGLGIRELDLCGANKPTVAFFKRGFGGKLCEQDKTCLTY